MHFRRKMPAARTRGGKMPRERKDRVDDWRWLSNWPAWWDLVFHRRPPRRRDKRLERAVLFDRIDADAACWPTWRKPHKYFW
jgi:hypothetical protein